MTATLLIVMALSGLFLAVVEFAKRMLDLKAADTRRIAHLGGSLIAVFLPLFLGRTEIIIMGLVFAATLFLARSTKLLSSVHGVTRKSFGDIYFPLAIALSALIFLPADVFAYQFGMLVMGVSDTLASVVGERFGKNQFLILGERKSLEGSSAFFAATFILAGAATEGAYVAPFIIAGAVTLVEASLAFGLDNMAVPIAAGLLLHHQ
jgi:phytol kinase